MSSELHCHFGGSFKELGPSVLNISFCSLSGWRGGGSAFTGNTRSRHIMLYLQMFARTFLILTMTLVVSVLMLAATAEAGTSECEQMAGIPWCYEKLHLQYCPDECSDIYDAYWFDEDEDGGF